MEEESDMELLGEGQTVEQKDETSEEEATAEESEYYKHSPAWRPMCKLG